MDMADIVPASEFTRNFGRYRMLGAYANPTRSCAGYSAA
jgi:hypothetical protein